MNKLQSGDLKDQQLLFDLTMVLRELNQVYDERAAKKGIRYEVDWKNGTYSHIALIGNPVYLGRILSNIIDNAIKFSQSGSVITVWVKEETLDDGRVFFTFYCKDQGVGMSEDFIAHAFDMFLSGKQRQADPGMKAPDWGLRLRKQLVDRMGGTIELKSKAGVGTTVIVKIPFKIGTQDKNSTYQTSQ
ncbi:MAG: sensor histidine kinase [Lachnospiraceae bacterium]